MIIFDLETTCDNQSNYWDYQEIIEIGAVKCDNKLRIVDTFDEFIKPIKNIILTNYCTVHCKKLTSIYQKDINQAANFSTVLRHFINWCVDKPMRAKEDLSELQIQSLRFGTWGEYNYKKILEEHNKYNLDYNFIKEEIFFPMCIDIKREFAKRHGRKSLKKALGTLNMKFIGTQHRAINDAINTWRVLKNLRDYYPAQPIKL